MFKKINPKTTFISAITGAVLFSIPVYFYIHFASYRGSWLLYLGSFLFMAVMFVSNLIENRKRGENESTVALIFIAVVTAITGIVISCLICFLLLVIFVPGYLGVGETDKVLTDVPVNTITDKTGGMSFDIFMAATIINFSVGAFTGIILPFYSKRNQTRDSKEPVPLKK
jgi:hypothetical protein